VRILRQEGVLSRLGWRLRPSETIRVDSIRIRGSKYLALTRGGSQRLLALMRINLEEEEEETKLDYSGAIRMTIHQQRMKGLFEGLHKTGLPFLYITMMTPMKTGEDEEEVPAFEFDLVVGTWVDGKEKSLEASFTELEQRANVLAATLSVAIPNSSVRRLNRAGLSEFVNSLLLPGEPKLPQVGNASVVSSLETFEARNPMVSRGGVTPEFYLPNSSESGRGGLLLGNVRTRGAQFHEFRLGVEDLRQHVAILGMTGAGKSTTAAALVGQIAKLGLPVMVMDWHNEYGTILSRIGGRVLSPTRDDFTLNPLEGSGLVDRTEHIEMVTDIFADIYRFTHPQSFMFRNALQKCLGEASRRYRPSRP